MKVCYFLVLVVLFTPTTTYKTRKIGKFNINQKCENIKCPPIDEPVCVKIKNKHMNEIYVIAINKCEIKYANCHKDVDAVIVPMEKCLHDVKNDQNSTRKRNKREIEDSEDDKGGTGVYKDNEAFDDDNENNENKNKKLGIDDNEDNVAFDDENEDDENKDKKLGIDDNNEDNIAFDDENEDNEKKDKKLVIDDEHEDNEALNDENENNENEGIKLGTDDEAEDNLAFTDENEDNENEDNKLGTDVDNESTITLKDENAEEDYDLLKDQSEENEGSSKEKVKKVNDVDDNESEGANNSDKPKEKVLNDDKVDEDDAKSEVDDNNIQKLTAVENVGADYDQHDQEVDLDESNKKCPTVCPSRDVMVCAKCRHNIHRTFLSQCHLRMFACKHKEEKLILVKREPCVQSAPFIAEFKETKGKIPESGEKDAVHKFIVCRDKKMLNKDDPRCRFADKQE